MFLHGGGNTRNPSIHGNPTTEISHAQVPLALLHLLKSFFEARRVQCVATGADYTFYTGAHTRVG